MPTGRRPTPATPRSCTAPSTCTKRPTRDTSRVGTGRESGTLGDPRVPHVAAGESRRDRRGTAPPTPLWRCLSSTPKAGGFTAAAASADRAMRAGRVPRIPRWLRQPRHGSRARYCPFTLASGSDPRHESRVGLLAGQRGGGEQGGDARRVAEVAYGTREGSHPVGGQRPPRERLELGVELGARRKILRVAARV